MSEIIIYQAEDNKAQVEVTFEQDSVWLSQKQMGILFGRDYKTISKHIINVFKEGELDRHSVVANFATTADDGKTYQVEYYNLDVIISVGYRVKSPRGTQFRIWATQTLKEHLMQGYTLNEKRLLEFRQGLEDLERAVQLIQSTGTSGTLDLPEVRGLLDILGQYTQSFILLNRFDNRDLPAGPLSSDLTYEITYPEARVAIEELKRQLMVRKEASALFANEKAKSCQSMSPVISWIPSPSRVLYGPMLFSPCHPTLASSPFLPPRPPNPSISRPTTPCFPVMRSRCRTIGYTPIWAKYTSLRQATRKENLS